MHCNVLCCVELCCAVLYCVILHCMAYFARKSKSHAVFIGFVWKMEVPGDGFLVVEVVAKNYLYFLPLFLFIIGNERKN